MMERKNIDRLFQERFKDFEQKPDDAVWKKIEAQLEKEDRKIAPIIPLWAKFSGVAIAALVLLSLILFNNNTTNSIPTNVNTVTDTNTSNDEISAGTENTNKSSNTTQNPSVAKSETNNKVVTQDNNANTLIPNKKQKRNTTTQQTRHTLTALNSKKDLSNSTNNEQKNVTNDQSLNNSSEKGFALADSIPLEEDLATLTEEEALKELKKDTPEEENGEDDDKNKGNKKKWSVGPSIAPVYYNSLSNDASSIASEFNGNTKAGNVNLSYGLEVTLALNKKWSLRSGINKVDLGYQTNNVAFTVDGFSSQSISSINYNHNASPMTIENNVLNQPDGSSQYLSILETNARSEKYVGSMTQNISYIEVPMEVSYALLSKKIGVNIIGGLSTLFLNSNEILLQSDNITTEVGTANNINNINFSTNIGLGVHYGLSKKLLFNLQPMFKYQLNTYSDNNNFKPYTLGLYTGLSFKF